MPKTLSQWLNYIETLHPLSIALGLDRVQKAAKKLGVIQFPCPVITVAGTNGKGSCVAFIESIYLAAGYRVGAYISPHLLRFNERIRINGIEVEDAALCRAFELVERARGTLSLTYFEFTTLAAFILFKEAQLEALVLEVGLGGRLDAVNVVDSDVAVVTTIALDHMDWLGENREEIAVEKAGIFRENKPAICGDVDPPASLFAVAADKQAELFCIEQQFDYQINSSSWRWHSDKQQLLDLPFPQLPIQNAATALMAVECLQSRLAIDKTAIVQGLKNAYLPGRFQRLQKPVNLILDVAHNPAAAEFLAERLQKEPNSGRTLAVVSILADKDIPGTLRPLLNSVDAWFVGGLDVPRGMPANTLTDYLRQLGAKKWYPEEHIATAFDNALQTCQADDRIVVFGSFYTVASVLKSLQD